MEIACGVEFTVMIGNFYSTEEKNKTESVPELPERGVLFDPDRDSVFCFEGKKVVVSEGSLIISSYEADATVVG